MSPSSERQVPLLITAGIGWAFLLLKWSHLTPQWPHYNWAKVEALTLCLASSYTTPMGKGRRHLVPTRWKGSRGPGSSKSPLMRRGLCHYQLVEMKVPVNLLSLLWHYLAVVLEGLIKALQRWSLNSPLSLCWHQGATLCFVLFSYGICLEYIGDFLQVIYFGCLSPSWSFG